MHEVESVWYEKSQTVKIQGTRQDIEPLIKKGFYVQDDRNGNWVLCKPAKVNIEFENGRVIDIKEEICYYYSKSRISVNLFHRFESDLENGFVELKEQPSGRMLVVPR